MKLINKKDNQIVFTAEAEESLANAIRRYINQIPVMAINEVEISKNDSPLYDETIAHRMGLIPLKSKGIAKEFKLQLSGNKEGMIYSGEITGDVEVVYDKIPITSLKKGQKFEVTATTKMGKGSEHARFSPGLMFYRNVVDLKIDKDCPHEVVNICPKKILKLENGKVVVEDNEKCDSCESCVEICGKKKKDSIKIVLTKELMITLESFGQLSLGEMFKESIEELKKDLGEFDKKVSKAK
jgi:DNA-directed RNA polymerase subunit D